MSCAGRVEAPQPRDENNNMTLYQPIHRNGMAGLPHDTMTGANMWILRNGGFKLWRVELTAVEAQVEDQLPRREQDRPFIAARFAGHAQQTGQLNGTPARDLAHPAEQPSAEAQVIEDIKALTENMRRTAQQLRECRAAWLGVPVERLEGEGRA